MQAVEVGHACQVAVGTVGIVVAPCALGHVVVSGLVCDGAEGLAGLAGEAGEIFGASEDVSAGG